MDVLYWIATNIFGTPAILLGFIVLVGLLLQKKSTSQLVSGTFKAIIGFLIIGAGSDVIVKALNVFEPMWKEVFGLESGSLGTFMGQEAFNSKFGSAVTLAMLLGFLINVALARFTRFKFIYLTGHMMFWTSTIFAGVIVHAASGISIWKLVLMIAVVLGVYWTFQPALVQPFLRKITG
ncbi:PTS transporter subunit IIC, partial [Paenibacillus glucanolyticus]